MKELIEECLELQVQLNKVAGGVTWEKMNYNWQLYAATELAECCGHLSYEHWKDTPVDHQQAFIEVIDILHFVISDMYCEMYGSSTEYKTAFILNALCNSVNLYYPTASSVDPETLMVNKPKKLGTQHCFQLFKFFHKTPEQVFQMYLAKDVLNLFRQNHGYKQGTYNKIWSGREDNMYLDEIVSTFDFSKSNRKDRLYKELKDRYTLYSGQTEG
ncbi:MAG: putative dUTPase [Prokaryotic dsDNA virus sp.]|nr:MAG: putative dUTPase [Prokaryotic dsDNA virus sp.]